MLSFSFGKKEPKYDKMENPQEWYKTVYNTLSESELWREKPEYETYLAKIRAYGQEPFQKDLENSIEFTRGILFAVDDLIPFEGGYDFEFGVDAFFEHLSELFEKTSIAFTWKQENDSSFEYTVDGSRYTLTLSDLPEYEDFAEAGAGAIMKVETDINSMLGKYGLLLVNTPTTDQTGDYLIIKDEHLQKLKKIFPTATSEIIVIDEKTPRNF